MNYLLKVNKGAIVNAQSVGLMSSNCEWAVWASYNELLTNDIAKRLILDCQLKNLTLIFLPPPFLPFFTSFAYHRLHQGLPLFMRLVVYVTRQQLLAQPRCVKNRSA